MFVANNIVHFQSYLPDDIEYVHFHLHSLCLLTVDQLSQKWYYRNAEIVNGDAITESISDSHCRDIHPICQQWASNGDCLNTDFVRFFCPISCRNPKCSHNFPSLSSINGRWRSITDTLCDYPRIMDTNPRAATNPFFESFTNLSLSQCQSLCTSNPLCTHLFHFEDITISRSIESDLIDLVYFHPISENEKLDKNDFAELDQLDNEESHICIHSFFPLTSCRPICPLSSALTILRNSKMDKSSATTTAQMLSPLRFSSHYHFLSSFTLSMDQMDIYKKSQTRNAMTNPMGFVSVENVDYIRYQRHEYYVADHIQYDDGIPLLEAPKLSTFPGNQKVRIEFESRIDRPLDVSWVNTRSQKEYLQETLDGDNWSITKARNRYTVLSGNRM